MVKFFKFFVLINCIFLFSACSFQNKGGFFEDETQKIRGRNLKKTQK